MTDLFLSPHNDDETLFGAFTILRYKPHVIVCLKSRVQELRGTEITAVQRETETARALWWLGDPTWEQWQYPDTLSGDGAYEELRDPFRKLADAHPDATVFAPEVEEDGHEQHDAIGRLAYAFWPQNQVRPYLTYRRGHGRSVGTEVEFEPSWPAKKLRALSCYETQIAEPSTAYWFLDSGLREYTP